MIIPLAIMRRIVVSILLAAS